MTVDDVDVGVTKAAPSLLAEIRKRLFDLQEHPETISDPKLILLLEPFQEAPQLLDQILESIVTQLADVILKQRDNEFHPPHYEVNEQEPATYKSRSTWPFEVLYTLCKVRGYKTVSQFLPSHVTLLEDVLTALEEDDHTPLSSWQERYGLLLWLSILVLAPFELGTFGPDIQERLYNVATKFISISGKERDAASLVMSRLITRSDTVDLLMPRYFADVFETWALADTDISGIGGRLIFSKLGIIQCTAMVFRLAPSDNEQVRILYEKFLHSILLQSDRKIPNESTVFDKVRVKNLGRIGLVFLSRSGDDFFDKTEGVLGELLECLSHKDSLVRYSASKSVARIVQKLPSDDLRLEVIDAVMSIFGDDHHPRIVIFGQVSASSWHGALLCLAEMLRRKLLIPELHFNRLTRILSTSIRFEQQRLTYSLGSNVRDATCYVCWSLFRVYQNIDQPNVIDPLFEELVNLACYDPEVNIRRAASAALQEGVGRHGGCQGSVVRQVELVQTIEYFKVGLRTRSYLEIPLQVYDLKFESIVDYVLDRTVSNWDPSIRRLSGVSLGLLAKKGFSTRKKIIDTLIGKYDCKDLDLRHGTVYALGEVLYSDSEVIETVTATFMIKVLEDFTEYDLKEDNELLHCDAFLHLFRCLIKHQHHYIVENPRLLDKLTMTMERTDPQITEDIRQIMDLATPDLLNRKIIDQWIQRMMSGKVTFALALGLIPRSSGSDGGYWLPNEGINASTIVVVVLEALINVIRASDKVIVKDLSTRAQAVHSISCLIQRFSSGTAINDNRQYFNEAFEAVLYALNDYTMDSRGDVGSWVRQAAMEQCERLNKLESTSDTFRTRTIERLLGMSVEVLPKLRLSAIKHLRGILSSSNGSLNDLISTLPPDYDKSSRIYFGHMIGVFKFDFSDEDNGPFKSSIASEFLKSYVSSAGAQQAGEDTLRGSSGALLEYLYQLSDKPRALVDFLDKLAELLDIRHFGSKLATCALKVFASILESGLTIPLKDYPLLEKKIYIRTFNCHINTKSLPRIYAAIEIFAGLAQYGHHDSFKRLGVLCKHSFPVARVQAAESLREVFISMLENHEQEEELIMEAVTILEDTDW